MTTSKPEPTDRVELSTTRRRFLYIVAASAAIGTARRGFASPISIASASASANDRSGPVENARTAGSSTRTEHAAKPPIVLFIPLDEHDLSFSEAAYNGYKALRDDGYPIDVVRNADRFSEQQMLSTIDQYHANGVRGFVLAGAELSAATTAAAARFPDTHFATVSGTARGANVVNFCLDCHPLGGELAGTVAARESRSKTVGFVGGVQSVDGGEAKRFRKAVLDAVPDATVLIDWTGAWDDRARAILLTERQIRAGADVVLADANDAVLEAASKYPDVKTIGWMVDASQRYPNVAASVIVDMAVVLRRFAQMIASGPFRSGNYTFSESDAVWKIVGPHR